MTTPLPSESRTEPHAVGEQHSEPGKMSIEPSDYVEQLRENLAQIKGISQSVAKVIRDTTDIQTQLDKKMEETDDTLQVIKGMKAKHGAELQDIHEIHEGDRVKWLSSHTASVKEIERKNEKLENDRKEQQAQLDEKDKANAILEEDGERLRKETEQMVAEIKRSKTQATRLEQEMKSLEQSLSSAQEGSGQRGRRVLALEEEKSTLQAENSKITQDNASLNEELDKIRSYSEELHKDPADSLEGEIKRVCGMIIKAVTTTFENDINDFNLQSGWFWDGFKKLLGDYPTIPLVPSNSKEAKSMRAAAVLAYLANLLHRQIFTSNFLLEDDSELRSALVQEAEEDPEKELLLRALLLSMQVEKQSEAMQRRVADVIERVSKVAEMLRYDPQIVKGLKSGLKKPINELSNIWWKLMRCTSKVEADTDLGALEGWDWKQLGSKKAVEESSQSDSEAEVVAVLFPRIYVVYPDDYEPVFTGIVLTKRQTVGAANELDRIEATSVLPGPPSPSRQRSVKTRRVSSPRDVRQGDVEQRGKGSFLEDSSQQNGHTVGHTERR